jgi:hypothetical protein
MSVIECQSAYAKFAKMVFGDPKSGLGFKDGHFKATNLKNAIIDTVDGRGQGDRMLDARQDVCRVFVPLTQRTLHFAYRYLVLSALFPQRTSIALDAFARIRTIISVTIVQSGRLPEQRQQLQPFSRLRK